MLAAGDPEAVIAVFTADHVIEPVEQFSQIIEQGFTLVERSPNTLATFGIAPTGPATGYGYLELGGLLEGNAKVVARFTEKPAALVAQKYFDQGPEHYLWNSGMFVWRASTLLDCIGRYKPAMFEGLQQIARVWHTPQRDEALLRIYPTLERISVDYAVLEPASADPAVTVAALPMALNWRDVGSWPALAEIRPHDDRGNALAAERRLLLDTSGCLVASDDPEHLIATIGCEGLIVVHTDTATLVCRADRAEQIKDLCKLVEERFGSGYA